MPSGLFVLALEFQLSWPVASLNRQSRKLPNFVHTLSVTQLGQLGIVEGQFATFGQF